MITKSHEISHRGDFSLLCTWRNLLGDVAEVGVDLGAFADEFLRYWRGEHFFGIDDFEPYEEILWPRDGDYLTALGKFNRHPAARLVREQSVPAAAQFLQRDYRFDFVYIDAAHDYASVIGDIAAWWPLISDRGMLAGHDFDDSHPGVVQAVTEFFADHDVYLTHEKLASWYVYKTGLPGPDWRRLNP